jgi:hypothetical protein
MVKTESVIPMAGSYTLAGWLAIASAIMIVPQVILAILIEFLVGRNPFWTMTVAVMNVVGLVIGIYVLYMFRQLLNERFSFHGVDTIVTILILANVASSLIGLIGLMPRLHLAAGVTMAVLFVPFGILSIVFGVKLLNLKDSVFGLLKPYAYVTIASGVCAATVLLSPFGLLLGVTALVIQGIIFLKASDDTEYL